MKQKKFFSLHFGALSHIHSYEATVEVDFSRRLARLQAGSANGGIGVSRQWGKRRMRKWEGEKVRR
jgi:hypothetical protein